MQALLNPEYTISVIIATYNRAHLLHRAIESVLNQGMDSVEIVLVDDGSTDSTFGLVDPYIQKYPFIKYLKHRNRKQPLSLNAGIQSSSGRYITFLDSDDEYLENHLKSRYDLMSDDPSLDLIHGGLQIIGDQYVPDKNNPSKKIHLDECVAGGTIFAKRELFFQLGGFRNIPYASDSDFVDRALASGKSVKKISIPTYRYYRDTPDSICNTILS